MSHPLRKRIQRPLRAAIYAAFLAVVGLFRLLGPVAARRLARGIGRLAGAVLPFERRVAAEGLARAFPDRSAAERDRIRAAMFAHLGEAAAELLFPERVVGTDRITVDGLEHVDAALAAGRGAVVVTGHLGNWELMAAEVAQRGYPITVIARRIYDDRLDRWMRAWRRRWGIHTLVRNEPNAIRSMLRALQGGHLVGILIDQDTGVPSDWVPFFGAPAKTPTAPARLAARGVPVLVAADRRTGPWRHAVRFEPMPAIDAGDERAVLGHLSAMVEDRIREAPEQWVWLHRRWRTPPPGADGPTG